MIKVLDQSFVEEMMSFQTSDWKSKDLVNDFCQNEFAHYFGYFDNGLQGYIGIWITFDIAQIVHIEVKVSSRRKGIGKALLDKALQFCQMQGCEQCQLEVRISNEAAKKLYEKSGFIPLQVRPKYYSDLEDALVMIKPLGGFDE